MDKKQIFLPRRLVHNNSTWLGTTCGTATKKSRCNQKQLNSQLTEPAYMQGPNPTEPEPLVVLKVDSVDMTTRIEPISNQILIHGFQN